MNTEIEVKVLEINHDEIIKKLESLNAKKVFDSLQQRYVYDLIPKEKNKWIRLRTNGIKTTITLKDLQAKTIDGMKEIEIEVDDFEKANLLLNSLGFKSHGFQQNKRVQYILNGVEIDLDKWPMIPEYLEIEGKNEEEINKIIKLLELENANIVTLDVSSIYEHYGFDGELGNLSFDMEEK